jgi:CubicO group peptidase (beta-lactamase class C family)
MRLLPRLSFLGALFLWLCSSLAYGQAAPLTGFDDYVQSTLRDWDAPGLAVSVVKDGKVVLEKGYGLRKVGAPAKIDERTLFAIGSISKSVTAMALGLLVDEGKISWDDPVTQYLPYFQLADPYASRELTIRDLLIHRSGLPDFSGGILWYGADYSREEALKRVRFIKPATSFRSTFAYQSVTYMAAGEIVRAVTGKSWDDFIRDRIFAPLGMKESSSLYRDLKGAKNLALPHIRVDGKTVAIGYRDSDSLGPAGSIVSNVHDMASYMRLLLAEGALDGKKLYSEKVARELFTAQMLVPNRPSSSPEFKPLNAMFRSYALGWFLNDYRGRLVVSHSGGMDGMSAVVILVPEEKLGITVLSHQDGSPFNAIALRILDAYLGAPQTDWAQLMLKYRGRESRRRRRPRKHWWQPGSRERSPRSSWGAMPGTTATACMGTSPSSRRRTDWSSSSATRPRSRGTSSIGSTTPSAFTGGIR